MGNTVLMDRLRLDHKISKLPPQKILKHLLFCREIRNLKPKEIKFLKSMGVNYETTLLDN